jgi:hypothetical protein
MVISLILTLTCLVQSSELLNVRIDEKQFCFWASGALIALGLNGNNAHQNHYGDYAACVHQMNTVIIPIEYYRNFAAFVGKFVLLVVAGKRVHQELQFK